MAETNSRSDVSIARLILVPSIISLLITLLRLVGELQGWSEVFFNRSAGGFGSIVGITWLAPIFGVYFALKLSQAGHAPASAGKAVVYSVLGLVFMAGGAVLGIANFDFPGKVIISLLFALAGAIIPVAGWSTLYKTLLAYGYAARIPVAILMFFAIRGQWGTHYDVLPPNFPADAGFWSTYFQIAFLPQMLIWIAFTLVTGSLTGSITAAVTGRSKSVEPAAA
ncbi:MAG TPA: hypothetical protein VID27_01420 [Blastocatellia bacterium]|jgi:hypothetical protein